jgi:hypothetical protein
MTASLVDAKENSFSLREKARMRGYRIKQFSRFYPLSPALSRRERGLTAMIK